MMSRERWASFVAEAGIPSRKLVPSVKLELRRKAIHLLALAVPFIYWFAGQAVVLVVVGAAMVASTFFELYRWRYGIPLKEAERVTRSLMRAEEVKGFGAHVYFLVGIFIPLAFYPQPIAVASVLMLALGDAAAALVGMRWGRIGTSGNRTLEGSLAMFLVALLAGAFVVRFPLAVVGAASAALAEYLPVNDNLSVPILAGLAMWAATYIS